MVQLAKRDPLGSRGSMDLLARRVTLDLQDKRDRQEKKGDLACLVGQARVAPWDLLGHRVLQEKEATPGPQGRQVALDCLVCPAVWETW